MENEIIDYKWFKIQIDLCNEPENPRSLYEPFSVMVYNHKRYKLWDMELKSYWESFDDDLYRHFKTEWIKDAIRLPLYLYDHSWITMSTKPFGCHWDSWQVWFIYMDYKKIKEEYNIKRISKKRIKDMIEYMEQEIKDYDAYLTWEVYCAKIIYPWEIEFDWLYWDCWDYYNRDTCISDAKFEIDSIIKQNKLWTMNLN